VKFGGRFEEQIVMLHAGFFFGLLFSPENREDMFLRNVGLLHWTSWRYIQDD
jgi:hypothetical protein